MRGRRHGCGQISATERSNLGRALRKDMEITSDRLEFERAAALRYKVRAIERTMESQKMAAHKRVDEDVLAIALFIWWRLGMPGRPPRTVR